MSRRQGQQGVQVRWWLLVAVGEDSGVGEDADQHIEAPHPTSPGHRRGPPIGVIGVGVPRSAPWAGGRCEKSYGAPEEGI